MPSSPIVRRHCGTRLSSSRRRILRIRGWRQPRIREGFVDGARAAVARVDQGGLPCGEEGIEQGAKRRRAIGPIGVRAAGAVDVGMGRMQDFIPST
jgi:hypothetical protein